MGSIRLKQAHPWNVECGMCCCSRANTGGPVGLHQRVGPWTLKLTVSTLGCCRPRTFLPRLSLQAASCWETACSYELRPTLSPGAFALGCLTLQRFHVNSPGPGAPHSHGLQEDGESFFYCWTCLHSVCLRCRTPTPGAHQRPHGTSAACPVAARSLAVPK